MIVQAADRFRVPPWELLGRGRAWVDLALTTLSAERRAEAEIAVKNAKRARRQSGASSGRRR